MTDVNKKAFAPENRTFGTREGSNKSTLPQISSESILLTPA